MTITDEHPPLETPPDAGGPPEPEQLRRSATKRLVAGVAGGISERFDVDVTIVRVAFVVAACFWGLGAVLYLAMWALLPPAGGPGVPGDADRDPDAPARTPWLTYVLLTGALVLGLMLSSTWWGGPRWGSGLGIGWLLVLFGVVVVALRRPTRRLSLGRVLLTAALVVLSMVILATAAFFGAVATTGVPLTGGIGQRVIQPSTEVQLASTYRLAIGSMTVDLTRVRFTAVPRTIHASVGVGTLVVDVPPGATVDVRAQTSIGSVDYGSSGPASFASGGTVTAFGTVPPPLVVDAQVGIGQIRLQRGDSFPGAPSSAPKGPPAAPTAPVAPSGPTG